LCSINSNSVGVLYEKAVYCKKFSNSEIAIPLPNGGTLRCGPGYEHEYGGHIRICDSKGNEIMFWESTEWATDDEGVIGAAFSLSLKSMKELTENMTLFIDCPDFGLGYYE